MGWLNSYPVEQRTANQICLHCTSPDRRRQRQRTDANFRKQTLQFSYQRPSAKICVRIIRLLLFYANIGLICRSPSISDISSSLGP